MEFHGIYNDGVASQTEKICLTKCGEQGYQFVGMGHFASVKFTRKPCGNQFL